MGGAPGREDEPADWAKGPQLSPRGHDPHMAEKRLTQDYYPKALYGGFPNRRTARPHNPVMIRATYTRLAQMPGQLYGINLGCMTKSKPLPAY